MMQIAFQFIFSVFHFQLRIDVAIYIFVHTDFVCCMAWFLPRYILQ